MTRIFHTEWVANTELKERFSNNFQSYVQSQLLEMTEEELLLYTVDGDPLVRVAMVDVLNDERKDSILFNILREDKNPLVRRALKKYL